MNSMYGRKLGMTRIFDEAGSVVPVTVIEMLPNVIHQVKSEEGEGYRAVQIGIGSQKAQRVNKAQQGHFAKAKKGFPNFVAEIRLDERNVFAGREFKEGEQIELTEEMFSKGSKVDVTGTSIGKGHAGVMKRHHMKGAQTNTHGTHEYFRHAGSIGCRKFPGRVFKNKRMSGRMGFETCIQEGLEVAAVRAGENLLLIKGAVPGPKGSEVFVRTSLKRK